MFGNVWKMLGSIHLALRTILENLRKSLESCRKSSDQHRHWYVYIINRILHACLWIQILSSRVQLNIS